MTGVLFGGPDDSVASSPRLPGTATVLITVKASPNPSATYGETVCVAGIRVDQEHLGWTRLYPINFRDLEGANAFNKYDVVDMHVTPQINDSRLESWKPNRDSLKIVRSLSPWDKRRSIVEPYISGTTCEINTAAKVNPTAPSLALVRPADVSGLDIELKGGWSLEEQAKIDGYVNQLSLLPNEDRRPLQAPRFTGHYRYRCEAKGCNGHRQQMLDWEFTAFQYHRLRGKSDAEAVAILKSKWLDEVCGPGRDVAFYLGNQAKRRSVFSILGVWWPKRS